MSNRTQKAEIIIIGGGVIGLACAYYLARTGRQVILLEKHQLGSQASYGNAGWVSHGFAIPMATPGKVTEGIKYLFEANAPLTIKPRLDRNLLRWLVQFSRACNAVQVEKAIPLLLEMGQKTIALIEAMHLEHDISIDYRHAGRVNLFKTQAAYETALETLEFLKPFQVEAESLEHKVLREWVPQASKEIPFGLYCPNYASLNPMKFTQCLADLCRQWSVSLMSDCEVVDFETSHYRMQTVVTNQGRFSADQIVLAGGAWSSTLAKKLGLYLPIQPAKGYSVTYPIDSSMPTLPLLLDEKHIAVTPMGDYVRFTSYYDLVGFDNRLDARRLQQLTDSIADYFPQVHHWSAGKKWCGFRPATPDDLPLIGRSKRLDNAVIATGHGSLGVTNSLATGQMVAQIVNGEPTDIDGRLLNPDRFL